MWKRRALAAVLAVFLLVPVLSGCESKSTYKYYGEELSRDTLRICVDSWRTDPAQTNVYQRKDPDKENREYFESLAAELKEVCDVEKIMFEMLPQDDVARRTKLQRLRTEIMAGEGPDVFIVQTTCDAHVSNAFGSGNYDEAIFNYPEKNMDVGIFLPLDEYMENNTRFTDWSAQTGVVLNAGRSDEGQVLIPMTYEIPLLVYPKDEVNIPYTTDLTKQEILDDPDMAKLGAVLYTTVGKSYEFGTRTYFDAIRDTFGKYADYESEELLFTEEDLYAITNEAFKLREVMDANDWPEYEWMEAGVTDLVRDLKTCTLRNDTEMCLMPRYTKDGGVTARATAFMAVNRSTKFPEESFAVIDYLMREESQRNSRLYNLYFCDGFPLQNDLGSQEKPLNEETTGMFTYSDYLSEQHMEELLRIKEQITAVNIESELDIILEQMWYDLLSSEMSGAAYSTDIPREPITQAYEKMARAMKE